MHDTIVSVDTANVLSPRPEGAITFHGTNNEPMFTIKPDGTILFGPNYHPDEAARVFWDAVLRLSPFSPHTPRMD